MGVYGCQCMVSGKEDGKRLVVGGEPCAPRAQVITMQAMYVQLADGVRVLWGANHR